MRIVSEALRWSPLNTRFTWNHETEKLILLNNRSRLAIVCGAETRALAPLDDPNVEVWALNVCFPMDAEGRIRADIWWEVHPKRAQSESDMDFIQGNKRPCFTVDWKILGAPYAMPLRYVEICKQHGWPIYFTCTMAFQLMMALHLGRHSEISFYGVELLMGNQRERTVEAACLSFWLGIAWKDGVKGVKVTFPDIPGALLRSPYVYGFDYEAEARDVGLLVNTHMMGDMQRAQAGGTGRSQQ